MVNKYEDYDVNVPFTSFFVPNAVFPTPPDERNFLPMAVAPSIPARASARLVDSPARNQGGKGSCTCFAAMAILENAMAVAGRNLDGSEEYLYARLREIHDWLCQNTGTFPGDAMGYLVDEGTLTEERRPYSADFCQGTGLNERIDAGEWKATEYVQCQNLHHVKQEIAAGHKVMICMEVRHNIVELIDGVLLPDPRGASVYGAHAMVAEDYDDGRYGGTLTIQNSWSASFGQNGRFLLPYWIFELPEDQGGVWKGDLWTLHVASVEPQPDPFHDVRSQVLAIGAEMLGVMDNIIASTRGYEKYQNRLRRQGIQAFYDRLRNEI